ncbi:sushi, von Willebrand factor type A, EGF and pentraxin domain-containing protein 1-like [Dreissena polymorpha]|uniref:sushi, von Willebrand factor type A, EGF and pentraxin domain-containing protein 1-like n=1 Tax=Dreissena polymorpha TaxID=45954 RepID=UPI002263FE3F|nr:sushi, von Willebrand factor type A, EGF and pentraxin domain-containing protein 1-like [Dreissena polymorpha]
MGAGINGKIGDPNLPVLQLIQVDSVDKCKQLCLNDKLCKEASYAPTSGGQRFCFLYGSSVALCYILGFNGTNCEIDNVNNCATAGCQNNASCMDMVGSFKCFFPSPSITGTLCNITSAPCDSSPCRRGTCTSHGIARYQCTCPDGYTGLQCETNINDCLTAECLHGGTCSDLVNGYVCNCTTGFTGRNCEIVGNFCQPGDCDVNNVCYSSLDKKDGLCACGPEFFDPVYICTFTSIPNTQIVGVGQYKAPVKVTSLPQCESLCKNDATCLYAELNGDMFCSFYNIDGSLQNTTNYTVLKKDCPTSGDAYKCHRKSTPCDNSPCKNGAACSDDGFNATCACAAGFTGSLCQHNINDCRNNDCRNNATCVDGLTRFTCLCPPGFAGSRCETDLNECPQSQCNTSRGTCVDQVNGYVCICKNGYTGRKCEVDIDECLSNPCKHKGTCQNKVDDYTCTCPAGWTGKDCSTEINYCANRTCQNAQCYNLQNTSFCRCEGGASGENCENATKVCDVLSNIKVCTNTGNCTDKPGTAECKCPIDYSGVSCEFVKDWCSLTGDANPCKNGGQCSPKGPLGYMCTCKTGYSGPNCTTEANPCLSNPCGGNATCYHNVTDYICQCPEGKTLSNKQCLGESSQHVLLVNTLYCTSPPVLQSPFRWTPGSLSVMLWVRSHNAGSSLFSIWLSSKLHPNYASGMDEYGIIVNTSGIYASNNTNWMGIRFSTIFGGNLHDGKWRHLGVSISAAGKMSATIDAITYPQEVAVDPLPTSAQNGQVRLGEEYVAEYERLTVWNAILSNVDFTLAFGQLNEPSTGLIQGWYNYDLKFSADRMTTRLPENILAYPNLNFPMLNCGPHNLSHVSSDRIVSSEILSSLADDLKASNNQSLTFKNSLLASMTWGYYEAILVGIDPTTNNYGECRTQAFIKYNARCPNPVNDNNVTIGTCPQNTDAVCNVSCSMSNTEALFAPLPRYMACSSVGVWWNKKPYENLILPGCTTKGTPSYKVTSEMKFAAVINCNIVSNLDTEVGQKLQVTFSGLNSNKWTNICKKTANTLPNTCDNLEIINKTCETGTPVYNVKFALTFDSKTLTPFGGGAPVSVLDVLRINILLEKDLDASFGTIASSILQTGTVVISMTEVCGTGYALMKDDTGSICVPCGAGWFLDSQSKQCVPCEYGFYQPSTAQTMCTQCPSGNTTYSKGSKAASDCVVSCPIGKSYNATAGECMDCPRHYYQNETGKNFCKPCPIGFKTVGNGSNSNTQCKEDCPAGYTRNPADITKCMRCPRGTYRNTQDDCQACPAGKYTMESTVAIIASNCDMDNCSLGEYWNTSTSKCTPCPIGEYQNTLYQVQCKMCNTSYSTNATGSSDVSAYGNIPK